MALAACSGAGPDVATMDQIGGGQAPASQALVAIDMVNCLVEAQIPARVSPLDDDWAEIELQTDESYQMMIPNQDGTTSAVSTGRADGTSQATWEELEDLWDQMVRNYYGPEGLLTQATLFISTHDFSDQLSQCLDATGYVPPSLANPDFSDEIAFKTRTAKAGARWAACARSNGFPSVVDPDPPKADGFQSFPLVYLPFLISPEELEALLAVCPNFDAAAQGAYEDSVDDPNAEPIELPGQPMVQITVPDDWEPLSETDPEVVRMSALSALLDQGLLDYNMDRYGHY